MIDESVKSKIYELEKAATEDYNNAPYLDEYLEGYRDGLHQAAKELSTAPTVDAVPVVHGEWTIDGMNEYELSYGCIGYEPRYRCSRCGITTESYLRTEKPIMPEDADFPNYCPNCGAKMDGKEKTDADS